MSQIHAPWNEEQVKGLNAWQQCDWVHPFTCGNRNNDAHHKYAEEHQEGDHGILIATEKGWVCPVCDYTQKWAHDFMALGAPPNPLNCVLSGMSMNTITFKDLNGKRADEVIFLQTVVNQPSGVTITFNKGLDERTRGNRRYMAQLWPGAGHGKWEYAGEEGELEKVTQKNLGKEILVNGIWVEAGERLGFEVYFLE